MALPPSANPANLSLIRSGCVWPLHATCSKGAGIKHAVGQQPHPLEMIPRSQGSSRSPSDAEATVSALEALDAAFPGAAGHPVSGRAPCAAPSRAPKRRRGTGGRGSRETCLLSEECELTALLDSFRSDGGPPGGAFQLGLGGGGVLWCLGSERKRARVAAVWHRMQAGHAHASDSCPAKGRREHDACCGVAAPFATEKCWHASAGRNICVASGSACPTLPCACRRPLDSGSLLEDAAGGSVLGCCADHAPAGDERQLAHGDLLLGAGWQAAWRAPHAMGAAPPNAAALPPAPLPPLLRSTSLDGSVGGGSGGGSRGSGHGSPAAGLAGLRALAPSMTLPLYHEAAGGMVAPCSLQSAGSTGSCMDSLTAPPPPPAVPAAMGPSADALLGAWQQKLQQQAWHQPQPAGAGAWASLDAPCGPPPLAAAQRGSLAAALDRSHALLPMLRRAADARRRKGHTPAPPPTTASSCPTPPPATADGLAAAPAPTDAGAAEGAAMTALMAAPSAVPIFAAPTARSPLKPPLPAAPRPSPHRRSPPRAGGVPPLAPPAAPPPLPAAAATAEGGSACDATGLLLGASRRLAGTYCATTLDAPPATCTPALGGSFDPPCHVPVAMHMHTWLLLRQQQAQLALLAERQRREAAELAALQGHQAAQARSLLNARAGRL